MTSTYKKLLKTRESYTLLLHQSYDLVNCVILATIQKEVGIYNLIHAVIMLLVGYLFYNCLLITYR